MSTITIKAADYPFTFTTNEEGLNEYINMVAKSIDATITEWYNLGYIECEAAIEEVIWEGELNSDLGGWWHSPKYYNDTITINGTTTKMEDVINKISGMTLDASEDNTEKIYNALKEVINN